MHRLTTRKKKIISYEDLDLLAITDRRNSIKRNPLIMDCFHSIRYKARIYPRIKTNVTQNKQHGVLHTTNHYCISPLVCRDTTLSIFTKITYETDWKIFKKHYIYLCRCGTHRCQACGDNAFVSVIIKSPRPASL